MLIYLSRHGEASHTGPDKPSSLTPRGQADVTRMAEFLVEKKNFKINAIWHSPKTRAVQTAQIYWKVLENPKTPMEEKISLSPDGDIHEIYNDLLHQKAGNFLLVSHLPFLPDLISLLTRDSPGAPDFNFPTSGIAAFEFDKTFRFLWALDPGSLKK